jgi:nucleoside-diphosphate-sugar epimerase
MDINPGTASFQALGDKVKVLRGDVTQFDSVMALVAEHKPERLINLSYYIGNDLPPHLATKLMIVGMDNCFEAARLGGVRHTVFASSVAVNGKQSFFGDRPANEDDLRYGVTQYAVAKIYNEWQQRDYIEKYGIAITCVRPANVTGPDKIYGSTDHVNCVTYPARGRPITFPYKDAMRAPIHVDDIAEVFARVALAEKPKHNVYNSGGSTISLGDLAGLVREFIPEADIRFEKETGARANNENYLIDNRRLVEEFAVQYPPLRQRVLQIINEVRAEDGKPPLGG